VGGHSHVGADARAVHWRAQERFIFTRVDVRRVRDSIRAGTGAVCRGRQNSGAHLAEFVEATIKALESEEGVPKHIQMKLTHCAEERDLQNHVAGCVAAHKIDDVVRINSAKAQNASRWMTVMPDSPEMRIDNSDYTTACRMR
jgi:hypothetical protein